MKKVVVAILAMLVLVMVLPGCGGPSVAKIGVIEEITGSMPAVGKSGETAAKLAVKKINDAGGITVGGKKYKVELVVEDSGADPKKAAAAATKLIEQDNVLAIIGPNSSSNAVAAADVANKAGVLMIAPWSTNPTTTLDAAGKPKKTVYRACFTDYFESEALGAFTKQKLNATKAAVLYDDSTAVLKNQAQLFKTSFEANGGKVVALETFKAGATDYSAQLDRIKAAAPDILFLPSYYTDVATQVNQARAKGITATFIGSDAWSTPDLIKKAGANIEGSYLFNHYSAESPAPLTQEFVMAYKAAYNSVPDDVAALTSDSFGLLSTALANGGALTRTAALDGIGKVKEFKGATGTMLFSGGSHDPRKSGVVIQIKNGKFNWFADVEPAPGK